jgi:hypothetical protein
MRQIMKNIKETLFLSSAACVLTACGGGGGSSTPPPPPAPATFGITATVSGLNGTVVLQRNAANDVTVTANGTVTLGTGLSSGAAYTITVLTQPGNPAQTCAVANGTGTLTANVSNVTVTCTNIPLALSSSTPANNATGVSRTVSPVLTFSRTLDAATVIPANITLTSAAGGQTILLNPAGATATVTVAGELLPATEYTLVASAAVRGAAAEQLPSAARVTFTTADSAWGMATHVEGFTSGNASRPKIKFDGNNIGISIWDLDDGSRTNIYSSRYTPGTGWGTPQLIEVNNAGDAMNADIAVNAAGQALAVWEHSDGTFKSIMSNRYVPGTGWGSPQFIEVGGGDAMYPKVGIDAQGNGFAIWQQGVGNATNIYMSRFDTATGWSPPVALGLAAFGASSSPALAVRSNGDAFFLWRQLDLQGQYSVIANRYVAGTGLVAGAQIEQNDAGPAQGPQIAVDAQGNAIAIWSLMANNQNDLWGVRFTPTGGWAAPALLETGTGHALAGQVSLNAAGDGFAVWQQYDGAHLNVWANHFTLAAGWGTATLVEHDDAGDVGVPQIAVDSVGNAIAVWRQSNGTSSSALSARFVNGAWGAPVFLELSTAGVNDPQIAIDGNGEALALWQQHDGTNQSIWSNRFE